MILRRIARSRKRTEQRYDRRKRFGRAHLAGEKFRRVFLRPDALARSAFVYRIAARSVSGFWLCAEGSLDHQSANRRFLEGRRSDIFAFMAERAGRNST